MDRKRTNWILLALTLLCCLPLILIEHPPMENLPDWVLQASMLSGDGTYHTATNYSIQILPVPNSLGMLVIAGLSKFISLIIAAKIAIAIAIFTFVTGFVYLRRADGRLTPRLEVLALLFVGNSILMSGAVNFLLGLGIAFFAVGYFWRRAPNFAIESSVILAGLLELCYLGHFLAFFAAGVAVTFIALRTYYGRWKRYLPILFALAPSVGMLVWYALTGGIGSSSVEFSPLTDFAQKLGALSPFTVFAPITSKTFVTLIQFGNIVFLLALAVLTVFLFKRGAVDVRSPMFMAPALIFLIGLALPGRLSDLVDPGGRLMLAGFLLLLAGVDAPRFLRKEMATWMVLVVGAILLFSVGNQLVAAGQVDYAKQSIENQLEGQRSLLVAPIGNTRESIMATVRPLDHLGSYISIFSGNLPQGFEPIAMFSLKKQPHDFYRGIKSLTKQVKKKNPKMVFIIGNHNTIKRAGLKMGKKYRQTNKGPRWAIYTR